MRVDNLILPTSWEGVNSDNNTVIVNNVFGVADHNTVGDKAPTISYVNFVNVGHSSWLASPTTSLWGDLSWASPDTFGTAQAFYLENNLFNYAAGTDTDAYDGGGAFGGGRYVCRFNHFNPVNNTSGACANHGTDTGGRMRGARQLEAYYNTGTTSADNGLWGARSGVGIIFGNTFTGSSGSLKYYANLDAQRRWRPDSPWGACDGSYPWDTNDGTNYYPGGSGTSTIGSVSGVYTITDRVTTSWGVNQWMSYGTPFSIHDLDVSGGAGAELISNTSNSLTSLRARSDPWHSP